MSKPDPYLARTVRATMYQFTGKAYPHLEPLLDTMTRPQLHDLLRLVREVKEAEARRTAGAIRRLGLPPGIIR